MFSQKQKIKIEGIPDKVNAESIKFAVNYFLARNGITETIIGIHYLGGCSNHALKVTLHTDNLIKQTLLLRIPGSQSELLINRQAERINTAIVAELGICPAFSKAFTESNNVLQHQGYKLEAYLDNAESLTHKTFNTYRKQALAQIKKVHECGQQFEGEYNIIERIKLMCYSLQCVNGNEITSLTYAEGSKQVSLKDILKHLDKLEKLFSAFGKIELRPCHNDLPPFNFMKIKLSNDEHDIKIIDWEYSAMNDPMYELAYIANESGLHNRDSITNLLNDYLDHDDFMPEKEELIDRILFYLPLIDLKVAVWSLMQVNMCNQSQYIEDLRCGWGPERYTQFLDKTASNDYLDVINQLADSQTKSVKHNSIFKKT